MKIIFRSDHGEYPRGVREIAESTLGKVVAWALVVVTLVMTPDWSVDPINPIKMLAVTTIGFIGLGLLLANQKSLLLGRFRVPLILIIGFSIWQFVVFLVSGGEKLEQLFGTNGRNTGLVTYLAFAALFIVSMPASNDAFLKRFLVIVLIVGVASLGYGFMQAVGADPFDWVNPYSPVFGFLGNPNFQASLLGILGVVVFTQLLSGSVKIQIKGAYLAYLLVTLYVIKETNSLQGFLVLLIGFTISLGVFVNHRSRVLSYSYLGLVVVGFIAVLTGILNKGPLASLLYKDSVTYRGDYWRAGWKMTLENPIFGVGLDSYGDWYRRSRTKEAILDRAQEETSNAAHNVFLDISASGGFPLALIYVTLIALVVVSAAKVIKRSQCFNPNFVGLFSAWVCFQAQSIISINQIGLAVWGWVLAGLIIGYEINTRSLALAVEKKSKKIVTGTVQAPVISTLAMFIGMTIGLITGMAPYLASAKFKGALESNNPVVIQEAAYIWPVDSWRMMQVGIVLDKNKFGDAGLEVILDAAERFPEKFGVWLTLSSMTKASDMQKAQALAQMKRLDPLNPNLK
jgi:O-antigen ligase